MSNFGLYASIPQTDDATCQRYHTTARACQCPDRAKRQGGSYLDPYSGDRICKHIAHVRALALQPVPTQAQRAESAIVSLFGPERKTSAPSQERSQVLAKAAAYDTLTQLLEYRQTLLAEQAELQAELNANWHQVQALMPARAQSEVIYATFAAQA